MCADGYAGTACEGRLVSLSSSGGTIGPLTLAAGTWLYVSFRVPSDVSFIWSFSDGGGSASTMLQLTHTGTHPLLLARATSLPTLDTYDWPLSTSGNPVTDALVSDTNATWQLPLWPGEISYLGFYAYPGRVHFTAPCVLNIRLQLHNTGITRSSAAKPAGVGAAAAATLFAALLA